MNHRKWMTFVSVIGIACCGCASRHKGPPIENQDVALARKKPLTESEVFQMVRAYITREQREGRILGEVEVRQPTFFEGAWHIVVWSVPARPEGSWVYRVSSDGKIRLQSNASRVKELMLQFEKGTQKSD